MPAPVIPTLPDAPQRSDVPSVFVTKADAFVASMQPWGSQINAFGSYINGLALTGVTGPITDTALTVSTGKVLGRSTAGTGAIEELSLTEVLDLIGSAAQGDLLYRGASGWARLAAGTSGYVLTAAGAGANPAWAAAASGYTDEQAQDAIGAMVDSTLTYTDATPALGVNTTAEAERIRDTVMAMLVGSGLLVETENDAGDTDTLTVNAASAADVRTGTDATKAVTPSALSGSAAAQTLTDGATINWNMASGYNAKVTLGGNRTLATPTNPIEGRRYSLSIIQDSTGSRTVTWPSSFDWGTAGAPTLTTTAGKRDRIDLVCVDATAPKFEAVVFAKGFTEVIGTSYSDTYSNGDRRSIITSSLTSLSLTGNLSDLLNGNNTTGPGAIMPGGSGDGSGYMKFQLNAARFINGIKWYQSDTSSHGVWRWEWSDDNSSWTQLGSDFTLGGASTSEHLLSGSTGAHVYWRMRHMSGNRSTGPFLWEIEFKAGS